MSNNPLPYRHIQEQTERQLLNIMVDKLCCISENTTANNEYKIAYYQEISSSTGTITIPTGATILLNQLAGGADALVSTIDGVPTGSLPQTSGGVQVDVTSFDSSGNYVLSGTPSSYPVALIYWLKISAADYPNLDINNIIEENIPLLVDNIYTADGTLTGDRTVTGNGFDITFAGGSAGNNTMEWNGLRLFLTGNTNYIGYTGGLILHANRGLYRSSFNDGQFYFETTLGGAPYINRNVADANPSLIVDNRNASSTGDIAQFHNSTGTVASIDNDGDLGINQYIFNQGDTKGSNSTNFIRMYPTLQRVQMKADDHFIDMYEDNFFKLQTGTATGQNFLLNSNNATNTNPIAEFQKEGTTVASITNEGYITAQAATGTSDTVAIWDGTTLKKKTLKNQTILSGSPFDLALPSNTEYISIAGSNSFTVSENARYWIAPSDGTLSDFYINTLTSQAVDDDCVLTIRVNGSGSSLTITISAGQSPATLSNTSDNVSISAGDLITIEAANASTSSSARIVSTSIIFTFD